MKATRHLQHVPQWRIDAEIRRRRVAADCAAPYWTPYPDSPQERARESAADIVGYGGAAGGGKTDTLLGVASTQHRNAIIFRREYPQLKGIIERGNELFSGRARWNGQDKVWRLEDGRRIELGAVQYDRDKYKFRGRPHDLLGIDEATEIPPSVFWFLMGWLRSTVPGQRCRAILTFNPPTTIEGRWVIELFGPWLDDKHPNPAQPGELRWYARIDGKDVERPDGRPFEHDGETIRPMSRTFFPARLRDNPVLANTTYGTTLQQLPEPLRSQLLLGDFRIGIEDDAWQIIPTAWVDLAMARWKPGPPHGIAMSHLGMDVAHGGADRTVLAPRYGTWFAQLLAKPGKETPDGPTAAAFAAQVVGREAQINVDAIGWGASAQACLVQQRPTGYGLRAYAVNVATASDMRDRSGKFRMVNLRAEMYWRLKQALDPDLGDGLALPPDPELKQELCAGRYEVTPSGIKVEPKEAITERIGRSPDKADAVALTMVYCGSPYLTGATKVDVEPSQPHIFSRSHGGGGRSGDNDRNPYARREPDLFGKNVRRY
jgi:hypothetical protein